VGDRSEDEVHLVHEVWPTEREMKARVGIEHDHTTVGVSGAGMVLSHPQKLRGASETFCRILSTPSS
jgi:hypothetical protein